MSSYTTVNLTGEDIKKRKGVANQKALLFQFAYGGNCIGIYKSPNAINDGDTWSLTQGTLDWGDLHLSEAHPASVAAQRELQEELGREQSINEFHYFGSVIDCSVNHLNAKNCLAVTDYHFVFSYAERCDVRMNEHEVAQFKWEDVRGCVAALEAGGFMSDQKSELVKLGLRKLIEEVGASMPRPYEERMTNPQIARFLSQARWISDSFDSSLKRAS